MTMAIHVPPPRWGEATASGGYPPGVARALIVVVAGAIAGTSTSSEISPHTTGVIYEETTYTRSGFSGALADVVVDDEQRESTRQAVGALRRLSGLTWEQLGHLLSVSRRSVHFWASGKPLSVENEDRLLRVLDVIRQAYRGDARSTRTALLTAQNGISAFELLSQGRILEARELLGPGKPTVRGELPRLAASEQDVRAPIPPDELVAARHETVHREPGRARGARTVRTKKRDGS